MRYAPDSNHLIIKGHSGRHVSRGVQGAGHQLAKTASLIMPAKDYRDPRASEYGGYPRLIQPPVRSADEILGAIKRTDPDNPQSGAEYKIG